MPAVKSMSFFDHGLRHGRLYERSGARLRGGLAAIAAFAFSSISISTPAGVGSPRTPIPRGPDGLGISRSIDSMSSAS
jgi:hypothetical protein